MVEVPSSLSLMFLLGVRHDLVALSYLLAYILSMHHLCKNTTLWRFYFVLLRCLISFSLTNRCISGTPHQCHLFVVRLQCLVCIWFVSILTCAQVALLLRPLLPNFSTVLAACISGMPHLVFFPFLLEACQPVLVSVSALSFPYMYKTFELTGGY